MPLWSIDEWRARIGSSWCSLGCVTKGKIYHCNTIKDDFIYGPTWWLSSCVLLLLVSWILLLKCGDVERNPGPGSLSFVKKRSDSVVIHDDGRHVLIKPESYDQFALTTSTVSLSDIRYQMKTDFSSFLSDPFIGGSSTDVIDMSFETSAHIKFVWFISRQTLLIDGKEMKMPRCSSGDTIEISTGKASELQFSVYNQTKIPESVSISISKILEAERVFLFVGALRTGSKPVSFQLLESEQRTENIVDCVTKGIQKYGNMHVSSDGKVYTRTSTEQGNSCALLSQKITSGHHRWTFDVRCDFGASCCFGIARFPFKLSDDYIRDPLKHIYRHPGLLLYRSYRGLLYLDGRQLDRYLQPIGWQHNSSVKITLDVNMETQTMEVFRNGKSIGIAFTELTGPLQPVICFYASYEKEIELISYETTEASPAVVPKHAPQAREKEQLSTSAATGLTRRVTFDADNKNGNVSLSRDLTSISREKSQSGNAYCLLSIQCASIGVYRFSFVIETDQGASVCIGVTDVSPALIRKVEIGNIYLSPSLYLYRSFQGMLYFKGRELTKRFDEFWMSGTLVEMTVDVASDEAVIQYTVNGKDQGIAFSGLRPPLRPLIALYAGMEKKVTLIHHEYVPKVASRPRHHTSFSNDINTIDTLASKSSLPAMTTPRNAEQPSSRECMICGKPADTILLPCMHSTFCTSHAARTTSCCICNQQVDGLWNILTNVTK